MTFKCEICGFESETTLISHIIHKHNITIKQYKNMFNVKKISIPWNKGLTKYTDNRVAEYGIKTGIGVKKYFEKEENREKTSIATKKGMNNMKDKTCLKYWAGKKMSKKTRTRMSVSAKNSIRPRNITNHGKSKVELKLFKLIKNNIFPNAVNNKGIKCDNRYLYPDIIIRELNLIIEYDGAYYHKDAKNDLNRDKELNEQGFKILHYRNFIPSINEIRTDCKELVNSEHNIKYKYFNIDVTLNVLKNKNYNTLEDLKC